MSPPSRAAFAAVVSIAACSSTRAAPPANSGAPLAASSGDGAGSTEARPTAGVTPRPAVGTLGVGVYEQEFRHGDVHRYRSYLFFADRGFEFRMTGYEGLPSVPCSFHDAVAYGGTWSREGAAVMLTVVWEAHLRGGHRAESPERGCTEEGGAIVRTPLRTPRTETLAVGACSSGDLYDEAPCVRLDGAPWYRTSPADADPRAAWYDWCDVIPGANRPAVCADRR